MKHPSRILSLLLCGILILPLLAGLSACSTAPATENRITSVVTDGESIRIEASLTDGFLENYKEKSVYLFELPSVYSSDVDLSELDPISEAMPRRSMIYILSLSDGARSRLHSSYLLAAYDAATDTYTPLTPPATLSNPEVLATPDDGYVKGEVSIKGLISDHPADAIRLGIAHTVVDVPMEQLILSGWQEGAVSYVYGGVTRYLNAHALTELDETVEVYTTAGVEVYLRFILGAPGGTDVPLGLYLPGATVTEAMVSDYAVNMTTSFATVIMEGFFDFMADRYATPTEGRKAVTAFILGNHVNNGVTTNHAAGMGLASYITNYEKLTRMAYTALVSHNAQGRVYISTDSRRVVTNEQGWDTPAFLSAFAEEAALRGDYGWHVATDLYTDRPGIWEDDPDTDTNFFTVRNLGVLTDILDSAAYSWKNQPRRLLIAGFSVPATTQGCISSEENDNRQAASYAYAYLTCLQNGRVEALIYDVHTDPSPVAEKTDLRGLWRVALDDPADGSNASLRPVSPRPIYGVFGMMDTTAASSLSEALKNLIGPAYTKLETALSGKSAPITTVKGSGTLLPHTTDHGKASPLYTFNDGSLHGFADGGGLTCLELIHSEPLGINTLHACFERRDISEPVGLTVTIPATHLIGGKELILDLYGGQMGNEIIGVRPTVTLRLTRPSKGTVADGAGEIRYEASVDGIKSGSWQTVSFDVTEFASRLDASDEVTLTLTMDYPTDTAPNGSTTHHMGLAGVYVVGSTAATGTQKGLVIAVIVVLGLLIVSASIWTILCHRKKKA